MERVKSEEYRMELERCYAKMLMLGVDPTQAPEKDLLSSSMSSSSLLSKELSYGSYKTE
jgi:hypothetical protein